ncbi:MAG TPA: GGDEF domain-containing protein [Gammaproteobacteria bacterium]|nr:GGDEF domain-containing protein [Gammaproteobacteria bacterium]
MRTFRIAGLTPRIRFIVVSGLTLVPLAAILMVIFLFVFSPVFDALENAARTTVERMIPVHRLQSALQEARLPPRDFLLRGSGTDRQTFSEQAARVESAFEAAFAAYPAGAAAHRVLQKSRREWEAARREANALFRRDDSGPEALGAEFDVRAERAIELLDRMHQQLHGYIEDRFAEAEARKTQGIYLAVAAFVLSLAAGLAGGITMTRERRSLEETSVRDPLTGLFNRRGFESRLQEVARYTLTYNRPAFALLALDADRFKAINDTYGHQTGDAVLRNLAQVVKGHLRGSDFFARVGGDEFVLLLDEVDCGEVGALAERIRRAVEETPLGRTGEGAPIHGSVTIGCACFPEHAGDDASLMAAADEALYRAKEQGRNCVAVFADTG